MEDGPQLARRSEILKRESVQSKILKNQFGFRDVFSKMLIGIIADEDTCVCYILAGIASENPITKDRNFMVCNHKTTKAEIEAFWNYLLLRGDIATIFITQDLAALIKEELSAYTAIVPTIVQLPAHGQHYDLTMDPFLKKLDEVPIIPLGHE